MRPWWGWTHSNLLVYQRPSKYLNKNETSKVSTFFKSYYWSHKHHYDCYAMKWCYVEICHHDSSQKLKGRNDSKRQFIIQPHPEKICRLEIYSDTYTHTLSLSHTNTHTELRSISGWSMTSSNASHFEHLQCHLTHLLIGSQQELEYWSEENHTCNSSCSYLVCLHSHMYLIELRSISTHLDIRVHHLHFHSPTYAVYANHS